MNLQVNFNEPNCIFFSHLRFSNFIRSRFHHHLECDLDNTKYCVSQSENSIVLYQPIRDEYYLGYEGSGRLSVCKFLAGTESLEASVVDGW